MDSTSTFTLDDGNVRAWIEQETVHMKAIDSFGDPVELSEHDVRRLAEALLQFANQIASQE